MSPPPTSPTPTRPPPLFIRSSLDAFVMVQAALDGAFPLCTKSLGDREREQLQYHGSVVVWDETAVANDPTNKCKGKQRWKYSTPWTPSRMQGVFLLYRQVFPKKGPRTEHAPPLPAHKSKQELDEIFGAHKGNKEHPLNGLMRKTLSLLVDRRELHLINFYDPYQQLEDATRLPSPSTMYPYSRCVYNLHPDIIQHNHRTLSSTFTVTIRGAEKPKLIYAGDDKTSQRDLRTRQEELETFLTTTFQLGPEHFAIKYDPAPKRLHISSKHARDGDEPEALDEVGTVEPRRKKPRLTVPREEQPQRVEDDESLDSISSLDVSEFRPSSGVPSRCTSQPPMPSAPPQPYGFSTTSTYSPIPPPELSYPESSYPSLSYPVVPTTYSVDPSAVQGFKTSANPESFPTLNKRLNAEAPPSPIENVFPPLPKMIKILGAMPHLTVSDEYSPSASSFTSNASLPGYSTPPTVTASDFHSPYSTFCVGGEYGFESWTSTSTLLSAIERDLPYTPDTSISMGMVADPSWLYAGGFSV